MKTRFRSTLATAVAAFAFAYPLVARAADGRVVVELKDGSSVRGEVVEKVPGKQLTVQLATGEVRTIEWERIARMDEPSTPPPSQPSSTAPSTSVGITVHLASDDPHATLQQRVGTTTFVTSGGTAAGAGETWADVCVSPCGTQIPKNQTVRVAGDGVTPSSNFVLQRDARLDAKTGSTGLRQGGVWLTGVGVTAALLGALIVALDEDDSTGEKQVAPSLSYGLLVGGLLGTAGGITMIATSGTTVKDERGIEMGQVRIPAGKAFVVPATFVF